MKHWGFTLSVWLTPLAYASAYPHAYLSHVEGELSVQRAAEPTPEPGVVNLPVLPGDRIWTHGGSRGEVRLSAGSLLRLSENTKVDFVDFGAETIVRVWSGSVILKLTEPRDDLRLDSPSGSVRPSEAGTYRIDVPFGESMTLTVTRGAAELSSDLGSILVRSGETSRVDVGGQPGTPYPYHAASTDEFDSWSDRRDRPASNVQGLDVRKIPYEVQGYASDLSSHGDWAVESTYGYVWYPSVSVGWAPYRQGRFCYTPYGYTWVSYEPWGWAPYHYGRWGHGHRGWYWIPGSTWGPAWVSFAVGPYWVGWSPLGYHNRPVYVFDTSVIHRGKAYPRPARYGDDLGWNFATRDEFARRTAGARLDPSLVRASASTVRVHDDGASLDRNFEPRGDRRPNRAAASLVRGSGESATIPPSAGALPDESATPATIHGGFRLEGRPGSGERPGSETRSLAATSASRVERRATSRGSSRGTVSSPYRGRIPEQTPPRGRSGFERPSPVERERSGVATQRTQAPRSGLEGRPAAVPRVERERSGVAVPRAQPTRSRAVDRPAPSSRSAPVRQPGASRVERSSARPSSSSVGAARATAGSRGTSRPRQN